MHGRQVGGNATETRGDRVDLHLFDGIGVLTVRQVVGPKKAERQGHLQQQEEQIDTNDFGCYGWWGGWHEEPGVCVCVCLCELRVSCGGRLWKGGWW